MGANKQGQREYTNLPLLLKLLNGFVNGDENSWMLRIPATKIKDGWDNPY